MKDRLKTPCRLAAVPLEGGHLGNDELLAIAEARLQTSMAAAREYWQLRHRLVELIAEISLDLSHNDLMNVVDAVLSASG